MSTEVVIDLPWDAVDAGKGLAIDIGGSVIKMLFIHKDDWVEPAQRKQNSSGRLRLRNFSREQLSEAITFVKTNGHIVRATPDETVQIFTTGLGGSQFRKQITSAFNVNSTNITEMDCFIHAFLYLMRNTPRQEILGHMPSSQDGQDPCISGGNGGKPMADQEGMFPCLMYMCGSGLGGMMIQKDDSFTFTDGSNRGGRMFLGLGCLLTGVKTYDELIQLAIKGNAGNVALSSKDLLQGLEAEDESSSEDIAYFFGRAVGKTKADFKAEDVARCLLEMTIQDLINMVYVASQENNIKHIFFVGGFVNNPLARELICQMWQKTAANKNNPGQSPTSQVHFLKHGSHVGALGAYLNSKLQFISSSGKVKEATTE